MKGREVLCGLSGSGTGRGAAEWAAQRAEALGLRLRLVRVVPEHSYYRTPSRYADAVAEAQALLDSDRDRLGAWHPTIQILTCWQPGEPAPVLSKLSVGAEMTVLGSDRSGDRRGEGFGSVSFQAAVLCQSPVAVIPARRTANQAGVVVGIDGSTHSAAALTTAAEEARRCGEELTILHVVATTLPPAGPGAAAANGREPDPEALVSAASGRVRVLFPGLRVREVVQKDDFPANSLAGAAVQAKLLVIGCWGCGGLRKPIGSIAEKVLMQLPCPIIITRPARPAPDSGQPPQVVLP